MKRPVLWLVLALAAGAAWFVALRHGGDRAAALAEARGLSHVALARLGLAAAPSAVDPKAVAPRRVVVATVAATAVDLPITRAAVGWIEPMATVVVRARADGPIVEQRARDGATVREGDLLFRIDDREIRAQVARDEATLMRDQATLARTQGDLRRVTELLAKNAASQAQFDTLTAESKVAAANVAATQATLDADRVRVDYTTIRAPITGRLGTVRVTEGNLVKGNESGGTGLVTITQMRPLRASFSLPEHDLDLLRTAMAKKDAAVVRAYASGGDAVLATGRLSFVDSSVDQASGTVTAWALFPNDDDRLWPGQYVRVEIDLAVRPKTTSVPLVAVQPGQAGPFVYAVGSDGKVARRAVEVLAARGMNAALAHGVEPGERVVVEGQLRVREGTLVEERTIKPEAAPQARQASAGAAKID
jgi:membrane fusion protein, multidrug efflux system